MVLPHYNGFYHLWNGNKPRFLRRAYRQLLALDKSVCGDIPEGRMDSFILYAVAAERLANESAHTFTASASSAAGGAPAASENVGNPFYFHSSPCKAPESVL